MKNSKILSGLGFWTMPLVLGLLGIVSCDQERTEERTSEPQQPESNSDASASDQTESEALFGDPEGTIDGRKWTLSRLSDSFDAGLTIAEAKALYGANPLVKSDGQFTALTYIIETDDVYIPGVRMTAANLLFDRGKLENVRIEFTKYDE